MKPTLVIDPNPCRRYRWSKPCSHSYSGAHVCGRPAGHAGQCRCWYCFATARGQDKADGGAR